MNIQITAREAKYLIAGNASVTYPELCKFVSGATYDFDPVEEAFRMFLGVSGLDSIDVNIIKDIYANMGYGTLKEEDFQQLVKLLDNDGDGTINENDFRKILGRDETMNE